MGRRLIVKVGDIQRRRAMYWARHYEARNLVKCMPVNHAYICAVLESDLPLPELDVDADVVDLPLDVRQKVNGLYVRLGLPRLTHPLHLVWYWSEKYWMDFVRQYQNLPEPTEPYYYLYDLDSDVARLVPVSSKPKKGSVVVPNAVDKPVGKLGTSKAFQVQVRSGVDVVTGD